MKKNKIELEEKQIRETLKKCLNLTKEVYLMNNRLKKIGIKKKSRVALISMKLNEQYGDYGYKALKMIQNGIESLEILIE